MRTMLCYVVAAACLTLLPKPAPGQDKPKLLSINGFMFKGVFSELRARASQAELPWLISRISTSTASQPT